MPSDPFRQLLSLQEADLLVENLRSQLELAPRQQERLRADRATLEARLQAAEQDGRSLEVRRQLLDREILACEDKILRYKTQQLSVKKNEEYSALEHEIAQQKANISSLEDQALQQIDTQEAHAKTLTALRQEVTAELELLRQRLATIETQANNAQHGLVEAKTALAGLRQTLPSEVVALYDQTKIGRRSPLVVPLQGENCGGCHLKVSSGTRSAVLKHQWGTRCEQCGRILYLE